MLIATLGGHTISRGSHLEIQGVDDFAFEVLEVESKSFRVRWTKGDNAGKEDHVPFSLFEGIGQKIELRRVEDYYNDKADPNKAWLYKRLRDE